MAIVEFISEDYLEQARENNPYKGSKKKTTDTFKEELVTLGINVIVTGEYTKAKEKIGCKCPECSYEWETTPNKLLSSKAGCPKCGGRVLPSTEEVNLQLKDQNKTFSVCGEITSSTQKLEILCNVCGFSWYSTYGTVLRSGYSCKQCAKHDRENPPQEKQDVLNKEFQDRLNNLGKNFTLVGNYNRVHRPVTVLCNSCGRQWTNNASVILASGCASCSGKLKGSLEKLQERLDSRNSGIIVGGDYVNAFTKVNCLCSKCGETWESTPHTLSNHGCPFCCFKGRIPRNRPAYLYYVRISDNGNTYWKIGITTKSNVMDRFVSDKGRKKITPVYSFLFENGEHVYYAEKNILRLYKNYILPADIKVLDDGNTEVFTKDVLQMGHLINEEV